AHGAHARIVPHQVTENLPCAVAAAVVDEDELKVFRQLLYGCPQPLIEHAQAVAATVDRHNHAQLPLAAHLVHQRSFRLRAITSSEPPVRNETPSEISQRSNASTPPNRRASSLGSRSSLQGS